MKTIYDPRELDALAEEFESLEVRDRFGYTFGYWCSLPEVSREEIRALVASGWWPVVVNPTLRRIRRETMEAAL